LAAGVFGVCVAIIAVAFAQTPTAPRKAPPAVTKPVDVTIAKKGRRMSATEITRVTSSRAALKSRAVTGLAKGITRTAISLPKALYLQRMSEAWSRLDANGDFSVSWQGANPSEPLGAKLMACTLVDYAYDAGGKDPTQPGKVNPPTYKPKDWVFFHELLSATSLNSNECESFGTIDEPYCLKNNQKISPPVSPWQGLFPTPGSASAYCQFYSCKSASEKLKEWCQAQGGTYGVSTSVSGCASWYQLGPDSRAAFLAVAEANFDKEDKNKDGVIAPNEAQYLCEP
jgi:hypothetical protein